MGTYKHAHNQYLTFLVSFGIVGFCIICCFFVYAFRRQSLLRIPVVLAFVSIVLISFITEDTLETLAGCVFSTLFLCLMAAGEAESGERRTENGERRAGNGERGTEKGERRTGCRVKVLTSYFSHLRVHFPLLNLKSFHHFVSIPHFK
jgi:hypothetical protein